MADHTVRIHIPPFEWTELPFGLDIVITAQVDGKPVTKKGSVDRRAGQIGVRPEFHGWVENMGIGTWETLGEAREAVRRKLVEMLRAEVAWEQVSKQLNINLQGE